MRGGANAALNAEMERKDYAIFDPLSTRAQVKWGARHLSEGGAIRTKPKEVAAARKMDAETEEAVACLRLIQAKLSYLVYEGAFADWLRKDMNVSQELFNSRKAERACFACGATNHNLYSCPKYTVDVMDKVGQRRYERGVKDASHAQQVDGRERGRFRETRIREDVNGRTKKGLSRDWKAGRKQDERRQGQAPGRAHKLDQYASSKAQSWQGSGDSATGHGSSGGSSAGSSDESLEAIRAFVEAGPGNGRRGRRG